MYLEAKWLVENDTSFLTLAIPMEANNKIYGACVRTDNNEITGFGEVARLKFTIDHLSY
ncbi:MAG: hypothetical protein JKX95_08875 [Bacteroidia bacterium]|nr:hypothetical protein [Bacteroidia bacterium]